LTALSGPRNLYPLDAVIRAVGPRNGSSKIAMVLEKIEMSPSEFLEIVGLAHFPAFGTRVLSPSVSLDTKMEFMRILFDIKALINKFPRWG